MSTHRARPSCPWRPWVIAVDPAMSPAGGTPTPAARDSSRLYNLAMADSRQLATFIREWLDSHKLSALSLAQRAGIPHTTLSALFNHGNVPRPVTLKKIATAMGVPLGQLLVLAGHLSDEEYANPIGETDLARLYEVGDLSGDEWEQVLDFARYVRSKRNAP